MNFEKGLGVAEFLPMLSIQASSLARVLIGLNRAIDDGDDAQSFKKVLFLSSNGSDAIRVHLLEVLT